MRGKLNLRLHTSYFVALVCEIIMVTATKVVAPSANQTAAPERANLPLSPAVSIDKDILVEHQLSDSAAVGNDENHSKVAKHHLTREERLAKYRIQCQNLIVYLTTNVCPPNLDKKEVRNIKNQAKTHQWDSKSKSWLSCSPLEIMLNVFYFPLYYQLIS